MSLKKTTLVGLTQGRNQPSTRFRWAQYVSDFQKGGFLVNELESSVGAYAPAAKMQRPTWLVASLFENAQRTLRANRYDIRFLQRNLTATLCTWEPLLQGPFVFDIDDAIFLGLRGSSANRIARSASLILCGNNYLANHFEKFGAVEVVPTAVDANRFIPSSAPNIGQRQIIGWSGSSSGLKYVYGIESAIKEILLRYPNSFLKIVSDCEPIFKSLPQERIIYERWTAEREVEVLQEFTIGIMPLEDDPWARGKCSFKMLTYMAVGIPVVVSPVGMNGDLLMQTSCGYGASSKDDWVSAISAILANVRLASSMGAAGRKLVEKNYSRAVIAPKLVKLLLNLV